MEEIFLQYGAFGVVALVIVQLVVPALKEYVWPVARDQREREVRAIEYLAASLATVGAVLSALDQRLASVERDAEQSRVDVALLVERSVSPRRSPRKSPNAAPVAPNAEDSAPVAASAAL